MGFTKAQYWSLPFPQMKIQVLAGLTGNRIPELGNPELEVPELKVVTGGAYDTDDNIGFV